MGAFQLKVVTGYFCRKQEDINWVNTTINFENPKNIQNGGNINVQVKEHLIMKD